MIRGKVTEVQTVTGGVGIFFPAALSMYVTYMYK